MCSDIDAVRVESEVGEAATKAEEWFGGVAGGAILSDSIFGGLAGKWVFEFGGDDGEAVEEESEIEALLVLAAEVELANKAEEVGAVALLLVRVEGSFGGEVGKVELAATVSYTFAENIEGSTGF